VYRSDIAVSGGGSSTNLHGFAVPSSIRASHSDEVGTAPMSSTSVREEVPSVFFGGYCNGLGAVGWLMMIGFWGTLLALAVWVVARLFPSPSRDGDTPPESIPTEPSRTTTPG
jgi:hypothetical protein